MATPGTAKWNVQVTGIKELRSALTALGDMNPPYMREALIKSGRLLQGAAAARAPGSIAAKVDFIGIRGGGLQNLKAVVRIDHPGGRSMEFGRIWYYRAHSAEGGARRAKNIQKFLTYSTDDKARRSALRNLAAIGAGIGNNRPGSKRKKGSMKRQFRFRSSPGQPAKPYLGVIHGNAAIGAVKARVERLFLDAITAEWERINRIP